MEDTEKHSDLKIALRNCIQDVCSSLKDSEIPERRWMKVIRDGGKTYLPEEKRKDYAEILTELSKKYRDCLPDSLKRLLEITEQDNEFSALLLKDARGNPIHENIQSLRITSMLVYPFLLDIFKNTDKMEFNDEVFNTFWEKLVLDIGSPNYTITELSPLMNTSLDCDRIQISPNLVIRKITSNELENWINKYANDTFFSIHRIFNVDFLELDCAIEATYERKGGDNWGASEETAESTNDLVSALRLCTDHRLYVAFTEQNSEWFFKSGLAVMSSNRPRQIEQNKVIRKVDQEDIVDTWNHIRALPQESPVRLALRRWNTVFERVDIDDAFIDYWIALESLFSLGSNQEVKYRCSFRMAGFLGETPDEREKIYKDMQDSYDLRSRIVHGGMPENKRKSELIDITRVYLRRALVKILRSIDSFNPKGIEIEQLKKQ